MHMPKTYLAFQGPEDCEECGVQLEFLILYGSLKRGCPECIPDDLWEKYGLEESMEEGMEETLEKLS